MQEGVPLTGFSALEHAVNKLDKAALKETAMKELKSGKKTSRPQALKVLQVLEGLDKNELEPRDLMISKVPVIPPLYRPFAVQGDTFLPGDVNELYRDLIQYKDFHNQLHKDLGDEGTYDTKYNLYRAVRGVYGYEEPVNPKTKSRGVSGFLSQLLGGGNLKNSVFHKRLFSKTQDSISRGVITAAPELELDEIGIPQEMAWKMYGPYIQRRLLRSGMSSMSALQNVAERTSQAAKALEAEMKERPVVYSRSPAWWRFSVLSGHPVLTDGDNIQINSYVTSGLGADFDGDQVCNYVVFAVPKEKSSDLLPYALTPLSDPGKILAMVDNIQLPVISADTHSIFMADLEQFPHKGLSNSKIGEKGRIDFFLVPEGTKVIAFDEGRGVPVWAEVAFYSKHYAREIETVTLACGKQTHTDDDPRAVYGMDPNSKDLELSRFTPSEALEKKVVVPFVKCLDDVLKSAGELHEISIPGGRSISLTWDTGYLFGAIAGDGWWDKKCYYRNNRSVYLSDLKGHNAAKIKHILERLFPKLWYTSKEFLKDEIPGRYGDTVKHTFTSHEPDFVAFCDFLTQQLGGVGDETSSGSANKHLPNFMLQAPSEFRKGLMCGIVDTDGSVSITHGHGSDKPSLICSASSTSHRLVRDIQLLAQTLGIQASISFSRITTAGNSSWIVNLSAVDCKRINIFADLQCPWKRENFLGASVSDENTSVVFNKVVVPKVIAELLLKEIPSPKITKEDRIRGSREVDQKKYVQKVWLSVNTGRNSGVMSRKSAYRAIALAKELHSRRVTEHAALIKTLEGWNVDGAFTPEFSKRIRSVFHGAYSRHTSAVVGKEYRRRLSCLNQPLDRGVITPKMAKMLLEFLLDNPPAECSMDNPVFRKWMDMYLSNEVISWSPVVSVEKSGQEEDGYDLTVPGYETFMSADGVILSNTMNVSLPSMPEAVEEAKERLMPSKMLLATKTPDTIVPALKHEQILGLYTAKNKPAQASHKFDSPDQALQALQSGQVKYSDEIELPD